MRSILFALLLCFTALVAVSAEDVETAPEEPEEGIQVEDQVDEENVDYIVPFAPENALFFEDFQGDDWQERWVKAGATVKYAGRIDAEVPSVGSVRGIPGDKYLVLKDEARHHGIAGKFKKDFGNTDDDFVVQYEVRLQNELTCGGAYMKILDADGIRRLEKLDSDSPYIIMFGPDRCGSENKVHFILRHKNPITHEWEEKHMKNPPYIKSDTLTHLYTLVIRKDNTYEVFIDQESAKKGNLLEDMDPPINPPSEIDDPKDIKPVDWVDEQQISDPEDSKPEEWDEDAPMYVPDPDAVKPDGWLDDEAAQIPDPEATKPEDWDDEEDGDFVAPLVDNPKCSDVGCGEWKAPKIKNEAYKGKWSARMIDNPAYKGEWKPKQIPNPGYFVDNKPYNLPKMHGIAFEIWTMTSMISFDNILITHDYDEAKRYADATFAVKHGLESAAQAIVDEETAKAEEGSMFDGIIKMLNDYVASFMLLVQDQPFIGAGAIGIILMPCLWYVFKPRKPTTVEEEKKDEGEEEEEKEDEAIGGDAPRARRRKRDE